MGAPIDSVLCRTFEIQVNVDQTGRVIQRRVQPTLESRIEETVKLFNSRSLTASAAGSSEDTHATSSGEESGGEERTPRAVRVPRSTRSKARPGLRKGKWTVEEEEYALALSHFFKQGILPLTKGKMLRLYLAEQLNCEPMRITKKFTGDDCIGKQVFRPCPPSGRLEAERRKALEDLAYLREKFLNKTSKQSVLKKRPLPSPDTKPSSLRPSIRPMDSIMKPTVSLMTGGAVGVSLTPMHTTTTSDSSDSYTMTFTCTPKIVGVSGSTAQNVEVKTEDCSHALTRDSSAENLLLGFYRAAHSDPETSHRPLLKKLRI